MAREERRHPMMNSRNSDSQSLPSDTEWTMSDELLTPLPSIDQAKIAQAVSMILEAIGEDPSREGLKNTPARVGRMYAEIFSGLHQDAREVLSTRFHVVHDEVVLVKDIPFYSACEHHLLPFYGLAHVAYLPSSGVVTGLSKLARLVDAYAKRPQVQERLTDQIAQTLADELQSDGVLVMIEAEHLCMTMRGVQKPGSRTTTIATRGIYRDDKNLRDEVLHLIH